MSRPDFWGFWWRNLERVYRAHKRAVPDRVMVHAELAYERAGALRERQDQVKGKHQRDWPRDHGRGSW